MKKAAQMNLNLNVTTNIDEIMEVTNEVKRLATDFSVKLEELQQMQLEVEAFYGKPDKPELDFYDTFEAEMGKVYTGEPIQTTAPEKLNGLHTQQHEFFEQAKDLSQNAEKASNDLAKFGEVASSAVTFNQIGRRPLSSLPLNSAIDYLMVAYGSDELVKYVNDRYHYPNLLIPEPIMPKRLKKDKFKTAKRKTEQTEK